MAVPEIVANIKTRYADFVRGARRSAEELERQRQQVRRNQRTIERYNAQVRDSAAALRQWGAVAGGAAAAGLAVAAREAAQLGEQLQVLSARASLSVEDVQAYTRVLAGDLDNVGEAILTFVESVGEARKEPLAERSEFFREIGLQLEDTQGRVRDTNLLFDDMLQRLAALQDVGRREAIARSIFGDEDARPILAQVTRSDFSQRLAEARTEARVVSAEQLASLARVRTEYHTTSVEFRTAMLRVFGDLEEPITTMLARLREAAPILEAGFAGALRRITEIGTALATRLPGTGGAEQGAEQAGYSLIDVLTLASLAIPGAGVAGLAARGIGAGVRGVQAVRGARAAAGGLRLPALTQQHAATLVRLAGGAAATGYGYHLLGGIGPTAAVPEADEEEVPEAEEARPAPVSAAELLRRYRQRIATQRAATQLALPPISGAAALSDYAVQAEAVRELYQQRADDLRQTQQTLSGLLQDVDIRQLDQTELGAVLGPIYQQEDFIRRRLDRIQQVQAEIERRRRDPKEIAPGQQVQQDLAQLVRDAAAPYTDTAPLVDDLAERIRVPVAVELAPSDRQLRAELERLRAYVREQTPALRGEQPVTVQAQAQLTQAADRIREIEAQLAERTRLTVLAEVQPEFVLSPPQIAERLRTLRAELQALLSQTAGAEPIAVDIQARIETVGQQIADLQGLQQQRVQLGQLATGFEQIDARTREWRDTLKETGRVFAEVILDASRGFSSLSDVLANLVRQLQQLAIRRATTGLLDRFDQFIDGGGADLADAEGEVLSTVQQGQAAPTPYDE